MSEKNTSDYVQRSFPGMDGPIKKITPQSDEVVKNKNGGSAASSTDGETKNKEYYNVAAETQLYTGPLGSTNCREQGKAPRSFTGLVVNDAIYTGIRSCFVVEQNPPSAPEQIRGWVADKPNPAEPGFRK